MRRTKPEAITTLLQAYLRQNGLESPLNEQRLLASWGRVVGETIAKKTLSTEIRNQTLVVKVDSPVLRSELMMRRKSLVAELNNAVNALVIYDIQIV